MSGHEIETKASLALAIHMVSLIDDADAPSGNRTFMTEVDTKFHVEVGMADMACINSMGVKHMSVINKAGVDSGTRDPFLTVVYKDVSESKTHGTELGNDGNWSSSDTAV